MLSFEQALVIRTYAFGQVGVPILLLGRNGVINRGPHSSAWQEWGD